MTRRFGSRRRWPWLFCCWRCCPCLAFRWTTGWARSLRLVQLLLATPVVLWGGWPFFERGWRSVATWNLNMFTLIAIGTGAAYLYSLVAVLFPALIPEDSGMPAHVACSTSRRRR